MIISIFGDVLNAIIKTVSPAIIFISLMRIIGIQRIDEIGEGCI